MKKWTLTVLTCCLVGAVLFALGSFIVPLLLHSDRANAQEVPGSQGEPIPQGVLPTGCTTLYSTMLNSENSPLVLDENSYVDTATIFYFNEGCPITPASCVDYSYGWIGGEVCPFPSALIGGSNGQ